LSGNASVVLIDSDYVLDTFFVASEIEVAPFARIPPNGPLGQPAVGDFDDDGRVEFIVGNNSSGHELFEWKNSQLNYVGLVGDTLFNGSSIYMAIQCRPFPDGELCALLGNSMQDSNGAGFNYRLMRAVGDNAFELVHTFSEYSGYMGIHPCWAADTDCDGMDELVMSFHPNYRVWEWDDVTGNFQQDCSWINTEFGSLSVWRNADLDQDGSSEWIAVNHLLQLYVFDDPDCVNCDSLGRCPSDPGCPCFCHGDPECNQLTNVFDVVAAVDVAFRSGPDTPDPLIQCPHMTTDVTCDNLTNVFDVVAFVDVAFRSADPATTFCDPCSP